MPFPAQVTPYADESLLGYVARLGHANHIMRTHGILKAAGSRSSVVGAAPYMPFNLDGLADLSGVGTSTLDDMAYWPSKDRQEVQMLGKMVAKGYVSVSRRSVCPKCIDRRPYHRSLWDLTPISACHRHKCELITSCPKCRVPLSWTFTDLFRCRCGFQFKDANLRPAQATEGVAQIAQLFTTSGNPDLLGGCDLSVGAKLYMSYMLGRPALGLEKGYYRPKQLRADKNLTKVLEAGVNICMDWPHNFHILLDTLRQKENKRNGRFGFAKQFGNLGTLMLINDTPEEVRDCFRPALQSYFEKHPLLRSRTRGVAKIQSPMMTLREAKKTLKRQDARIVDTFVKYGFVDLKERKGPGSPLLIPREAVQMVLDEQMVLASPHQAHKILGCGPKVGNRILSSWDVKPASGMAAELIAKTRWQEADVTAYASRYHDIVDTSRRAQPLRPLSTMLLSLFQQMGAAEALARLGNLRGIPGRIDGNYAGFAAVMVHGPSLLDALFPASTMSVDQAAKRLGVKQEVTYHLCRRQILKTVCEGSRSGKRVRETDLKRFANQYLFPSQLGHDKGRYPGWASDQMLAVGCRPVSGPGIDGGRQFLFRRKDEFRVKWPKAVR